jgi:hypothetical protein
MLTIFPKALLSQNLLHAQLLAVMTILTIALNIAFVMRVKILSHQQNFTNTFDFHPLSNNYFATNKEYTKLRNKQRVISK